MSRKKAILNQSGLDVLYYFINVFFGLLLVPYYLKFFSVELYGFWIATSGVIVLLDVLDLGINTLFTERMSRCFSIKNHNGLSEYFSSGVLLFFLFSMIISIVGIFISYFLKSFFELNEYKKIIEECFRIAVVTASFKSLNSILINFGSSVLKPVGFSIVKIISTLTGIIFVIFFLNLEFGLYSLSFAFLTQQIISLILNAILSLRLNKKITSTYFFKPNWGLIKNLLIKSKYLFFAKISDLAFRGFEPVLITNGLGPKVSSIYVLSKKASEMIYHIINIFTNSSFPSLVSLNQENDNEERLKIFNNSIIFLAALSLSFYIILNNDFLLLWVGAEFMIPTTSIILFAFSSFFLIIMQKVIVSEFSKNQIKKTSIFLVGESIFRVVLLLLLINFIGFNGGPLSTLISVPLFLTFINSKFKLYKFFLPVLLVFIGSILISIIELPFNLFLNVIFKIVLNFVSIYLIVFLSKSFKTEIIKVLNYVNLKRLKFK